MKTLCCGFLVLGLAVVFVGCGGEVADTGNPTAYAKDGLHFQMPGNWRVTEDEEVGTVRYLFVEEPGDALVVVQLRLSTDVGDLLTVAKEFAKSAKESTPIGKISASKFGALGTDGEYKTLRERFSISLVGESIPHTRDYRFRTFGDKTCILIAQVADEDRADVEAGFRQVMKTLAYEAP